MSSKQLVGRAGEELAEQYLRENGYTILYRNVRNKGGEVDIVTEYGETIVFVEVKARRSLRFGEGAESVHDGKQLKIRKAAQWVIAKNGWRHRPCRFDVISILFLDQGCSQAEIRHIPGAF